MNGCHVYPHIAGSNWCEQCNLPADICRGHYIADQIIPGIADVAGLKSFVTPDKDIRYSEGDRSSYDMWSFQVQLAGFLNECLDHPIVDDESIPASETAGTNTMRAPSVDVTALAQQIAALPVQTMTELAAAIVAIDATQADRFADMLLEAVYDATVVEFRPPFVADDLHKWTAMDDDIDYDYLPTMAQ